MFSSSMHHISERMTAGSADKHTPSSLTIMRRNQTRKRHRISPSGWAIFVLISHRYTADVLARPSPSQPKYQQPAEEQHLLHLTMRDPTPTERTNPLWREEFQYTGEQRGPKTSKTIPPRLLPRRLRRTVDRQRTSFGSRSSSSSTLGSEIPSTRVAAGHGGEINNVFEFPSFSGSDHYCPASTQAGSSLTKRIRSFRSQRGGVEVDLGRPTDPEEDESNTIKSNETMLLEPPNTRKLQRGNDEVTNSTTSTTTAKARIAKTRQSMLAIVDASKQLIHEIAPGSFSSVKGLNYGRVSKPKPQNRDVEVSVVVDPISLFRLLQNLGKAVVGCANAFGATLRLLAPMIVARRALSEVAYAGYDYYNGRYLRKTYNRQLESMQRYEVTSSFRALGRVLVQWLAMSLVGKISYMVLRRSPCFMPGWICQHWFGMIWILSVLVTARCSDVWIKNNSTLCLRTREKEHPVRGIRSAAYFFTRPWHILQWMKDPETWLLNLTRLQNRQAKSSPPSFSYTSTTPEPDALLFPSTWPPLRILFTFAMMYLVAPFYLPSMTAANAEASVRASSGGLLLLEQYCMAVTLHDEWERLFLGERRVALGLVVSAMSFIAYLLLTAEAVLEVGWFPTTWLLCPLLLASLVSGWMNALLYSEKYMSSRSNNHKLRR